jgi:hypothetical protein
MPGRSATTFLSASSEVLPVIKFLRSSNPTYHVILRHSEPPRRHVSGCQGPVEEIHTQELGTKAKNAINDIDASPCSIAPSPKQVHHQHAIMFLLPNSLNYLGTWPILGRGFSGCGLLFPNSGRRPSKSLSDADASYRAKALDFLGCWVRSRHMHSSSLHHGRTLTWHGSRSLKIWRLADL